MRLKGENKGQRNCLVGSSDSLLPGLHDDVTLNCLAWVPRSEYASLACLNSKFNSLIKSRYLDGFRKQMKIADYYVFLVCDVMHWQAFDTTRRKWMALPKIPCDDCFELSDKESLTVGNELLVFGRELFNFAIWKYSLVNGDWIKCQSMNFPRCLFASGSFGSITIVAGGSDMHGSILNSVECYDTESGTWELLPSMHSPRKMCSGFVMDGKFYIMGGISTPNPPLPGTSNSTVPLTCGEEYNLQTKKWRKIEGMYPNGTGASQAPPLLAVVDNQLYAAEHRTNTVKKYDKEKNSWNVLGKLPVRADFANGWGLAFKACGNQLLVVGGQRSPEGAGLVLYTCSPNSSFNGGELQWKVLDMTENVGIFVYNCAVMGC